MPMHFMMGDGCIEFNAFQPLSFQEGVLFLVPRLQQLLHRETTQRPQDNDLPARNVPARFGRNRVHVRQRENRYAQHSVQLDQCQQGQVAESVREIDCNQNGTTEIGKRFSYDM